VLKAVLHLLGRPPAIFDSWPKAQTLVGPELLQQLAAYDAAAARDGALWKRARACYKAVKGTTGAPPLGEAPPS
jgi:hypothetical protein